MSFWKEVKKGVKQVKDSTKSFANSVWDFASDPTSVATGVMTDNGTFLSSHLNDAARGILGDGSGTDLAVTPPSRNDVVNQILNSQLEAVRKRQQQGLLGGMSAAPTTATTAAQTIFGV